MLVEDFSFLNQPSLNVLEVHFLDPLLGSTNNVVIQVPLLRHFKSQVLIADNHKTQLVEIGDAHIGSCLRRPVVIPPSYGYRFALGDVFLPQRVRTTSRKYLEVIVFEVLVPIHVFQDVRRQDRHPGEVKKISPIQFFGFHANDVFALGDRPLELSKGQSRGRILKRFIHDEVIACDHIVSGDGRTIAKTCVWIDPKAKRHFVR